jgi:hypothetical protein
MNNVDDIGVVLVSEGDKHRPIRACSWQPGWPAAGWVGLDTWIQSGRTEVTVLVYDRQVTGFSSLFTAGKWTYGFTLSDKDGNLWTGSGGGLTNGGSVKYARRFVFERGKDGAIRAMPSVDIFDESSVQYIIEQFEDSMSSKGGAYTDFMGDSVNFYNVGSCN